MISGATWRGAVLAAVLCGTVLAGCQYGYSRSMLETEAGPPPEPRGYVGYGYDMGWMVSPWYFSFSYTYGDRYYPYPFFPAYSYYPYYYYPYYYYPPRYVYPYPYAYVPYRVVPAPRRTLRVPPGSSTAPDSTPPNTSRRRLNLP